MRYTLSLSLLLLACLLTPMPEILAAKVKVWHHARSEDFQQAQLQRTVVSSEGLLRLAHELKRIPGLKAMHIWDLVEDKQGQLYVATGDEGKLFRVGADNEVSLIYTSPDSQILSLAAGPDGSIYAGTGPTGTLVKIPPQGKPAVLAEQLGAYVWSLAVDAKTGSIYAGTGPKGQIYQVTPEGKATVFYTARQDHILCLAQDSKGQLYAGTDRGGLVYRIDPQGRGFVLYSAPQAEVRTLVVTAHGIYAGTSSPGRAASGSAHSSSHSLLSSMNPTAPSLRPVVDQDARRSKVVTAVHTSREAAAEEKEGERETEATPSVPAPKMGQNSLYRIGPDGTIRELFREKALILSLLPQSGHLLVGTGMQGQLFQINEQTKERSELARLDHGQIHSLLQRRNGSIVLGTGDPGKLYQVEKQFAAQGAVLSDVLDARILSRWGAATWRADVPPGTRVSVAFRSGNVALPDDTWSDWSAEQTDPIKAAIPCPAARFLQYRVTLKTDNPRQTPAVRSVTIRYMTTNHAPEITSVEVPNLDSEDLKPGKKLRLKWKAVDPNEDELTYALLVKKDGWQNWVALEENLSKTEYDWNTAAMPSGLYQIKVVASDRPDNTTEESLTAERISEAFPVSHLPPTVTARLVAVENGKAIIEARASDPLLRLTEAAFAVDGGDWQNVFPSDGLFDRSEETFRFRTAIQRPGTHVLVLRVQDAAGNIGTGDVVFTVPD